MKLNFKNSPTVTSEDMEVSTMGIADGAGDMLSSYLRDKIYTDKVLACIRETITNSQDEHVKYGIDRAVEVKIENVNGQYIWSSRDYAKGLSEQAIRTIYGMYGGSDKRDNNNQVGGFGIGALSPFSVSDTFYITSYHEGFKTQYACMLGAGANGVSVGEIYRVSDPEPTTESGLEVSLDISKQYYDFNSKTLQFVHNFLPDANIVYTDNRGASTKPAQPILTEIIDGYTVNLYEADYCDGSSYGSNNVAIRMGGVIYKKRSDIVVGTTKGKIVVDVPIGKLTIPISREDLENTENNKKVLADIQKVVEQIAAKDRQNIVTPSFGAVVIQNEYNSKYDGEWFTYSFQSTFPDSWELKRKLDYLHTGYTHNITNGKYNIYLIPDIKSYSSWVKRLDAFIAQVFPNTQIIWMKKPYTDIVSTDTLDVSDVNFIDVKKLGLPKLPKQAGQAEYLVYFNGYKRGSFTAEDLDESVTDKTFGGEEIADGWEKNIKSSSILKQRVIGLSSEYGVSNPFWVCNSKKMYDQLIELGWFTPKSKELIDRLEEIQVEEKKRADMENAEYRVKTALFRLVNPSPRTINAIGKKATRITKLEEIKNTLLKEDSFRGRILKSMDNYNAKVTREDLRKLLTMK
jgi:hypothetical protein